MALSIRERQPFAIDLGIALAAFYRRHRSTLILALAAAPFMAGVGAFDTSMFPAAIIFPYWLILMLAGGHIAMFALDWAETQPFFGGSAIGKGGAVVAALCLFQTPLVWLMAGWLLDGSWDIGRNLVLLPQVLLVATGFAILQLLAHHVVAEPPVAHSAPALSPARDFPIDLNGSLQAVKAEDHYLRFYTPAGSTLILMRFQDALAMLDDLDGAQIHRSWWVARDAVAHVSRKKGRAILALKNGLEVPVSRTHAPILRKMGWFRA